MVDERLFSIEDTEIKVPDHKFIHRVNNGFYVCDWNVFTIFIAKWEYFYDGRKFYIGRNLFDKTLSMLESTTMHYAVLTAEGKFKKPQEIIEKLKFKLRFEKYGRNIHEVIRDCSYRNIESNLCIESLLII